MHIKNYKCGEFLNFYLHKFTILNSMPQNTDSKHPQKHMMEATQKLFNMIFCSMCWWGCIWWTDRNSKNCPIKKIKDQILHFDEGPKINLPLQIKKQMCTFSKHRHGIFYPEFGTWWIRYLSVIWSMIPLYIEKITITDYKKDLFCFQNKDKHYLQGTTWGEIIRNIQWRSAGAEVP